MAKRAVCLGLDDYGGNGDLNGCVNDCSDWSALLRDTFGFDVRALTNREVTIANVQTEFEGLVTRAGAGDLLVVTYSGHGTWVNAQNETNADELADECWYLRDGLLKDDWLREAIRAKLDPAVDLVLISDSCHSGTMSRSAPATNRP